MKKLSLILLVLAGGLLSCSKQSLQTTYDKQTTFIENFVAARMKEDPKATLARNGGAYRITLHDTLPPARDSLKEGGRVSLHYACFTLTSASISTSNLVATNIQEVAAQARWTLSDNTRFKLDTLSLDKNLVQGLQDGLAGVQPGDEAYILFTGKYGFGNSEKGTIPALSALVYYILIEKIFNE